MSGTLGRLLLLCLLTPPLCAAQQAPDEEAGRRGGEATAPEAPDPPEPERSADGQSPFDYEASEEISEDLSVSFPVDI